MKPGLLALLALAACFDPTLPAGRFLCAAEEPRCPPGLTCQAGVCAAAGASAIDAASASADARPFPDGGCAPGSFVQCQSDSEAVVCAAGGGFEVRTCNFQCNAGAGRCEQCDPARAQQCAADVLVTCSSTGQVTATTPCTGQTFCHAPEGRCAILTPTNLPAGVCDAPAERPRTVTADIVIDTDACEGGAKITQSGGAPTVCMLRYSNFVIELGVAFVASGRNALAIVATGAMDISGYVVAAATGPTPGPGSVEAGSGGVRDDRWSSAGGGGGFGTAGATGGTEDVLVTVPGGAPYGNDELSPLAGGSPGGRGGDEPSLCTVNCPVLARGGGGGGAVQLVGCRALRFGVLSAVSAVGGGGEGGFPAVLGGAQLVRAGGGGGGGSGGGVLLESPRVRLLAGSAICANGGSGAEGSAAGAPGVAGACGVDDGAETANEIDVGGDGGGGGFLLDPAGAPGGLGVSGSGGGGGAAGRIRLHATQQLVRTGTITPEPVEQ